MQAGAAARVECGEARRPAFWTGTPEIYFQKAIDNSRLVKVEDPRREREMRRFAAAMIALFVVVMLYALQHFSAIEYGYRIAALQNQRDGLLEMNQTLQLEEASLRDPERIDVLARRMGLQSPQAGQVQQLDVALPENGTAVMASVTPVSVVSAR
jgi:cell division protein FtsL